jgi:hypothetical protein
VYTPAPPFGQDEHSAPLWFGLGVDARAKYLLNIGLDPTEAIAVVKVLTEGLARITASMRKPLCG